MTAGFYDDPASVAAYLDHRHSKIRSPNLVMEDPAFAAAIGELEGLRILDLGCGDGTFGLTCSNQGCSTYLGVDSSQEMIRRANHLTAGPLVEFVQDSIEVYVPNAAAYDLVTSRMALHYVEDLNPIFERVSQALVPSGSFVFSVIHPIITSGNQAPDGPRQTQVVDNYFSSGPRSRSWFGRPVLWHHRTIEQYLSLLSGAGLSLTGLAECRPVRELFAGDQAEYERRLRVPVFLLLQAAR